MRITRHFTAALLALAVALYFTTGAHAQGNGNNVDISTIPARDTVQLTIYNSQDLTLVRETRHLTFREGMNPLQFSWANTLIDPSSVDIRFLSNAADLAVVDTTFPHDKPQMLYWTIGSAMSGKAVVEISYFTSGISWAADYVCTANPDETALGFEGHVRVMNGSGEDYADAEVRLVVGEINLVEMIADLAQRGLIDKDEADGYRDAVRLAEVHKSTGEKLGRELKRKFDRQDAKQIVKEGLSEYFIYTIPGTETVPNGWSKRMRLFEGKKVPVKIAYRYREPEYGAQLVRLYLIRNDEKSDLGSTPLPDGWIRVFRDNGRDGLSFVAAHHTRYVPIGQEIEVNLGVDPLVVHERVRERSWRDNFWFHDTRGRKYVSPSQGRVIRDDNPVAGWDEHGDWSERIRNFHDRPIAVEIRRSFDGDIRVSTGAEAKLHDYRTPQFTVVVAADSKGSVDYELMQRQGINAKQSRVTLD